MKKYFESEHFAHSLPFHSEHISALSSLGPTGGATRKQCRMDTPVKPEYDRKEVNCHSGHSFLCHSGPRAGIQGNDNLMPKAFRLNGFSGRTPNGVCRRMTGESELSSSGPLSLSPSGLTGGSIKQQCRIAESGRSMVEMLGTLAIIGVLSLGALTAYRYAMNKYMANETAYHLNLRLTDLKTQLMRGQTLSLSEYKDHKTIFDFGEPQRKDTTIFLPVSDVDKGVCESLFDTLSDSVSSITVNAKISASKDDCKDKNDMTFSFDVSDIVNDTDNTDNNNSSDLNDSANDTIEVDLCKNIVCKACFTCEEGECQPLEDGSSCGDNRICERGICLTEEIPNIDEYKSCSSDADCTDKDKGCMECHGDDEGEDAANGKWCYPVQDGTVCEKNEEAGLCRDGYCEIDACNADGTCNGAGQYCSYSAEGSECTPTPEKCREVGDVFSRITTTYTDDSGNTQTQVWYVSKYTMNYFDALSACTALKKTIPNVKDLVIDWRGHDGNYTKNAKTMSLNTALNIHELIWTESTDSCKAYMMRLGGNYIYADYKSKPNVLAVCW